MMIIVSACLAGVNCKYDGGNNYNEKIVKLVKQRKAIPVCPEQLGGFETPRLPAEILGGSGEDVLSGKAKVVRKNGEDVSKAFIKGAYETLKIAKLIDCDKAILKSRSPSCGFGEIYDGSFSGKRIKGKGVTAALLESNGIKVKTEETI
jgi:uncharacterized protein YbbK (DUF523 family)